MHRSRPGLGRDISGIGGGIIRRCSKIFLDNESVFKKIAVSCRVANSYFGLNVPNQHPTPKEVQWLKPPN